MPSESQPDPMLLAERVRQACVAAAQAAWEDAGLQGLCADGRWEAAIGAMLQLPLHQALSSGSEA